MFRGYQVPSGGISRGWVCSAGGYLLPPSPRIHGILRDTVNKWTVDILLEWFLVKYEIFL